MKKKTSLTTKRLPRFLSTPEREFQTYLCLGMVEAGVYTIQTILNETGLTSGESIYYRLRYFGVSTRTISKTRRIQTKESQFNFKKLSQCVSKQVF